MSEVLIQITAGVFLFVITGLMAYITKSVSSAATKIDLFEQSLKTTEDLLKSMAIDLRTISKHDALIAVLQSEQNNMKADITFIFERIREVGRA